MSVLLTVRWDLNGRLHTETAASLAAVVGARPVLIAEINHLQVGGVQVLNALAQHADVVHRSIYVCRVRILTAYHFFLFLHKSVSSFVSYLTIYIWIFNFYILIFLLYLCCCIVASTCSVLTSGDGCRCACSSLWRETADVGSWRVTTWLLKQDLLPEVWDRCSDSLILLRVLGSCLRLSLTLSMSSAGECAWSWFFDICVITLLSCQVVKSSINMSNSAVITLI